MSTSSRRSGSTGSEVRRGAAHPVMVTVSTPRITLGEFLKWAGAVPTGGQAKVLTQGGRVLVNGNIERRRGRHLDPGDRVAVDGREYRVVAR